MTVPALSDLKRRLREEMLARRRQAGDPQAAGARLAAHVLREVTFPPGVAIGGFWPIGEEIDIRPLLLALFAKGHPLYLPETPRRGLPLIFRRFTGEADLRPGRFGTRHPTGETGAPGIFFVPLLAFDASGHRLGYGAGYYDRTLAERAEALRIGCAFAAQEVASVPAGPHDLPLDAVATEAGLRIFLPERQECAFSFSAMWSGARAARQ